MKIAVEFDLPEPDAENADTDPLVIGGLMLFKVAAALDIGKREGRLRDGNGNSIGTWLVTD